jgi:hypothetical protein
VITVGETYLSENFLLEDEDGNPAAATVSVLITLPNQSTDTPTVTSTELGTYAFNYTTQMPGPHRFMVSATGGFLGSDVLELGSDVFDVLADDVAGIVGLQETREHLRISPSDDDDETLRAFILTASDLCEAYTGRIWRRTAVDDEAHDGGGRYLQLRKRPVLEVSAASENGAAVASYTLNPRLGRLYRGSATEDAQWLPGRQIVTVSYVAGPPDGLVPSSLRHGVLECVRHLWESRRGGSGLPRQGQADEWVPILGYSVPRRVAELWDMKRRPKVA